MTEIISSISQWRQKRKALTNTNQSIGFVPTMGNLHIGHASLLERSKRENNLTILSIFVNPTQFNNPQDLANYPQTIEQDLHIAKQLQIDYILLPNYEELYHDQYRYQVSENSLSQILEGAFRPGHFNGVLTVVLKLLLLVKANRAYFGEKDYQQLKLIQGMASAFFLDTEIIPCTTIRLDSGLPHSSRNSRLSETEMQQAKLFAKIFHSSQSCTAIKEQLEKNNLIVDYVEDLADRRLAAVKIGNIRLIDNIPKEK